MAKVRRIFRTFLIGSVRVYQWTVSPLLGPRCRFIPSCSEYAIEAFQSYSILKAFWMTFLRLLRCHPFCKGGYDPVRKGKQSE